MQNPNQRNNLIAIYLGIQSSILIFLTLRYFLTDIELSVYIFAIPLISFVLLNFAVSTLFAKSKLITSFSRFVIIGGANTVVDFFIFNIFLSIYPPEIFVPAKMLSFIVALFHSLYWNSRWTFESSQKINTKLTARFISITITGLLINISIAYVLAFWLAGYGGLSFQLGANIATLVATVISLIWNFIGYRLFVFKRV